MVLNMVSIYILELENNKYYVGKSNNTSSRIKNHLYSKGSYWTQKYKPVKILEIIENCDVYDEEKYTLKYMDKYGINNVRGGSFAQINLSNTQIELIIKQLRNANDKCLHCGNSGHFIHKCKYFKHDLITNKIIINQDELNKIKHDELDKIKHDELDKTKNDELDKTDQDELDKTDQNKHIRSNQDKHIGSKQNNINMLMYNFNILSMIFLISMFYFLLCWFVVYVFNLLFFL